MCAVRKLHLGIQPIWRKRSEAIVYTDKWKLADTDRNRARLSREDAKLRKRRGLVNKWKREI